MAFTPALEKNNKAVQTFIDLFKGRDSCYGQWVPDADQTPGAKKKGRSYTVKEPLTAAQYIAHLGGQRSLGVVPLTLDSEVHFVAIDVDIYPADPTDICAFFDRHNLPFVCFRSKSAGLHAYLFFKSAARAANVMPLIEIIKRCMGLPAATETFPKQIRAIAQGNWINLPYYDMIKTSRHAFDSQATPLPNFEKAMAYCAARRITASQLQTAVDNLPLGDGPPCLQALFCSQKIAPGCRNIFLFNCCTYLKAKNKDTYTKELKELNALTPSPLPESELERTILSAHAANNYNYQCSEPVLKQACAADICAKRKFGKGSGYVSDFSFGKLVQVKSDPPYYIWTINNVDLPIYSEADLRSQDKFQDFCIRVLHKCPQTLKRETWYNIINQALENLVVIDLPPGDDLSVETLFFAELVDFFLGRPAGEAPGQVLVGQCYLDEIDLKYYFKVSDLIQYIYRNRTLPTLPNNQIHALLKKLDAQPDRLYNPASQKVFRCWSIEAQAVSALAEFADLKNKKESMPPPATTPPHQSPAELLKQALAKRDALDNAPTPVLNFPPLPDEED